MKNLYQEVKNYTDSDAYPFHMPGGKGISPLASEIGSYDITEIPGFDDLRHPTGILKEMEARWAKLYGAKNAHLLVNGSTCGNLSMIYSSTEQNGKIMVVGKHHWSIDNAAKIRNLEIVSLPCDSYPEGFDRPADAKTIEEALEEDKEISCVILTSPTYEGVVSDIRSISESVHKYNIPLLVDSAHGAHIGISGKWTGRRKNLWNDNPVNCGADAVVVSLHKTLPVMGQTSLLLTPKDMGMVDDKELKNYINIFQTSSPSYVLMSSASKGLEILESQSRELFSVLSDLTEEFISDTKDLKTLKVIDYDSIEMSKIVISTKLCDYTGYDLEEKLRKKYHLFLEKATEDYVIAMTGINDRKEGFDRLKNALYEIDEER